MDFDELMEIAVHGFESAGVLVLTLGSLAAFLHAAVSYRTAGWKQTYENARRNVGRAILLGLEFLIVADIVMSISVDPTLVSAPTLGLIVLVLTFLCFFARVRARGFSSLASQAVRGRVPARRTRPTGCSELVIKRHALTSRAD